MLEPVTVPPVCVIVPEPLARNSVYVPVALPPRNAAISSSSNKAKVPLAVIVPEVVKAPAPLAESVKLILSPVDIPLPVVALVSAKVTLPSCISSPD